MHPNEITLFNACITNRYNLANIKALLKSGVDVNKQSLCKRTLMHWTAENNNVVLTSLFILSGANIEITNSTGQTPLHLAVYYCSHDGVKCLLAANANTEALDRYGSTPLHLAAMQGCRACVDLLIQAGARLDSKNYTGLTPSELAFSSRYKDLSRYLLNYYQFLCLRSSIANKLFPIIEQQEETEQQNQLSTTCIRTSSAGSSSSNFLASPVKPGVQYSLKKTEEYLPTFLKEKASSQVTSSRSL